MEREALVCWPRSGRWQSESLPACFQRRQMLLCCMSRLAEAPVSRRARLKAGAIALGIPCTATNGKSRLSRHTLSTSSVTGSFRTRVSMVETRQAYNQFGANIAIRMTGGRPSPNLHCIFGCLFCIALAWHNVRSYRGITRCLGRAARIRKASDRLASP